MATRASNLWFRYKITEDEYAERLAEQDGVCWICQRAPRRGYLHVDHDHANGSVRGLLCMACNKGLGMFCDNEEWLERAAQYLRHNGTTTKHEW